MTARAANHAAARGLGKKSPAARHREVGGMGGNAGGRETRGVENVLRGLRETVLRGRAGGVSAGRVLVVEPSVVGAPLHGITRRAALVVVVGQRHGQQHEKRHYQRVI